jgi:hypothetical protein
VSIPTAHKLSLTFAPGETCEIAIAPEGVLFSGKFPANLHADRRSAREFARDFTAMMWPTSLAGGMARRHAAAAKRNRHKVM